MEGSRGKGGVLGAPLRAASALSTGDGAVALGGGAGGVDGAGGSGGMDGIGEAGGIAVVAELAVEGLVWGREATATALQGTDWARAQVGLAAGLRRDANTGLPCGVAAGGALPEDVRAAPHGPGHANAPAALGSSPSATAPSGRTSCAK